MLERRRGRRVGQREI